MATSAEAVCRAASRAATASWVFVRHLARALSRSFSRLLLAVDWAQYLHMHNAGAVTRTDSSTPFVPFYERRRVLLMLRTCAGQAYLTCGVTIRDAQTYDLSRDKR